MKTNVVVKRGQSKLLRSTLCRIDLKLVLTDKRTFTRTTYKVGQIAHLLATKQWKTAFLQVRYSHGHYNSGTYTDLDTALEMLNAFTEVDLIKYLTKKEK